MFDYLIIFGSDFFDSIDRTKGLVAEHARRTDSVPGRFGGP